MKKEGRPWSYLEAKYLKQKKQEHRSCEEKRLGMFKEQERFSVAGIQEMWGKWSDKKGHRGTVAAGIGERDGPGELGTSWYTFQCISTF